MEKFIQYTQYGGFASAQVINGLSTLYLLYTRAGSCFGRYRILMIVFSFYAMSYSFIEVLTLPVRIRQLLVEKALFSDDVHQRILTLCVLTAPAVWATWTFVVYFFMFPVPEKGEHFQWVGNFGF